MNDIGSFESTMPFLIVFGCVALYLLLRGLQSRSRSLRFGNFALCCGLAIFATPERSFGLLISNPQKWYFVFGILRALLGLAGIIFAVKAFRARRDGGVGIVKPLVGGGLSLIHLLNGGLFLWYASWAITFGEWEFISADKAYSLTFPSHQWRQVDSSGHDGIAAFSQSIPSMQAWVMSVTPSPAADGLARASDHVIEALHLNRGTDAHAVFKEEINKSGSRYRFWTGIDFTPEGAPIFVAYSATWVPQSRLIVEVAFEGTPAMQSESAKLAETEAFNRSAEVICKSVGFPGSAAQAQESHADGSGVPANAPSTTAPSEATDFPASSLTQMHLAASADLQGNWRLESISRNGGLTSAPERVVIPYSFDGNWLRTVVPTGDKVNIEYRLDPEQEPKQINQRFTGGTIGPWIAQGIYKVEGNRFTLCYGGPHIPRPNEFSTRPGDGRSLIVLSRLPPSPRD